MRTSLSSSMTLCIYVNIASTTCKQATGVARRQSSQAGVAYEAEPYPAGSSLAA